MAIEIKYGVVPRIDKAVHQTNQIDVITRNTVHTVDTQISNFVSFSDSQLNLLGSASSQCGFGIDQTFTKILADHNFDFSTPDKFLNICNSLVTGIAHFMGQKSATTGHNIPFALYESNGVQYLMFTLISLSNYLNIDEHGRIVDVTALDAKAIKVGVRINIVQLKNHYENQGNTSFEVGNYVHWIKRKNVDLPDYIQDFLPVSQAVDDGASTKKFKQHFDSYIKNITNINYRHELNSAIQEVLQTKYDNNVAVHVENDIDPVVNNFIQLKQLEIDNFCEYRIENNILINSEFKPSKRIVDSMGKFQIKINDVVTLQGNKDQLGKKIKLISDNQLVIQLTREEYDRLGSEHPDITG